MPIKFNYERERDLQIAIIRWYDLIGSISAKNNFLIIPNQRDYAHKSAGERGQSWLMGYRAGVPDLTIIINGIASFIELKSAKGRLSENQKIFMSNCERLKINFFLVRNFDDFLETIKSLGATW